MTWKLWLCFSCITFIELNKAGCTLVAGYGHQSWCTGCGEWKGSHLNKNKNKNKHKKILQTNYWVTLNYWILVVWCDLRGEINLSSLHEVRVSTDCLKKNLTPDPPTHLSSLGSWRGWSLSHAVCFGVLFLQLSKALVTYYCAIYTTNCSRINSTADYPVLK